MKTTVETRGFTTVVTRGEVRAAVSTRSVRVKVPTMKGIQHHRGYRGVVAFRGERQDCGHRLHTKSSAARACAVRLARRIVKEAEVASPNSEN